MSEAKRVLLVANQNAGNGAVDRKIRTFGRSVKRRGHSLHVERTSSPEAAAQVIQASIDDYDYVGFLGGDGSLRTGVDAVMKSGYSQDKLPILFVLPGGNINLFRKAVRNRRSEKATAALLETGVAYSMDVIRARIDGGSENGGKDMYFVLNGSLGLSGAVFNAKDRENGDKGGYGGYFSELPNAIEHAQDFKVQVTMDDGETKILEHMSELFLLHAGKAAFASFGPEETFDGKRLLAVAFDGSYEDNPQANALITLIGAAYDALHPGQASPFEERTHVRKIRIEVADGNEIPLQLDGDKVGVVRSSIEFEVIDDAVKILAKDQSKRRFLRRKRKAFTGEGENVRERNISPSAAR